MSILDNVMQGRGTAPAQLTLREAVVTVLVAAAACDGAVSPAESDRVGLLLSSLRVCRQLPPEHRQALVERALDLVSSLGPEGVLAACAAATPADYRPALFALGVEMVFADEDVAEAEKRFVDDLQAALGLDDDQATRIAEVMLVRSQA